MECRECYQEATERFKTKKLFLIHWLETSDMNRDWVDGECHSLHGLIEETGKNNTRYNNVPESWPKVTVHDKDSCEIFSYDEKLKKGRGIGHKEKKPKRWNKLKFREQSLAEINRHWADDNSNFIVWEQMPIHRNARDNGGAGMTLRERSHSVPPDNRIFYSRSFNQQKLALQRVSDLYKSKDDIDKPPPSCFPMGCCATSKTDFYSLASVNEENQRDRASPNRKTGDSSNNYPTVNDHHSSHSKGAIPMPNVVPSVERIPFEVSYSGVYPSGVNNQTRRRSRSSGCHDAMPDLLSSMDRPRRSRSRATSRAGSVSTSPKQQHLQYSGPGSGLSSNVYRPLYTPSALHRASGAQTSSTIHKVPPQALTPLVQRSRLSQSFHSALKSPAMHRSKMYSDSLMHPSFHFSQTWDHCDTYSNAGTTFTVYNIEPSGMYPSGYDTSASRNPESVLKTESTMARYHTGTKPHKSNTQARCLLKFGKKAHHNTKQPGYFSCPRKVDTLPSGEYIVLDTENQTLQVFSAKGLCNKVYQFKINILDMRVWSASCIALLYQNQVGLFDFASFELQEIALQDVLNPRVMDKMKDRKTNDKLFVIGTMSKVGIYDTDGKVSVTLGVGTEDPENPLFKRVNAVTVDRRNNDIYILDSEYKSIFAFSRFGEFKTKLDTTLCDLGPVFNPLGMCMSCEGHLLIADTFNHRVLHASQQGLNGLIQYSVDYYPNHVKITSDGRLLVAINSEGRTFAGVRVYDYRHLTMTV